MTLYNYDSEYEVTPQSATWAHMKKTDYYGELTGLYIGSFSRRFDANVTMSGGKLNIVGNGSPSSISNAGIIFKGPVASDSDNTWTLASNAYRKQGAINFNNDGGTVVVDGNVTFDAAVGFSSWSTSKPNEDSDTYYPTITSETNIDIEVKNNAAITVTGDSKTNNKYKDTAYGIHLLVNETENGIQNIGSINIILDNGRIQTSGSYSNAEAAIRIDNY